MIKLMRKFLSVFFLAISCLLCVPAVRAQTNSNLKFFPPLLTTPIYMDGAGRIYAPNTTLFDLQGRKLTNFVWSGTAGSSSSSNLTLLGTNGSMTVSLGTNGNVQFTLTTTNGVYVFDHPISVPGLTGGVTNQFVGTNQFQVYTLATSNAFQAYTNWAYTNFQTVSVFNTFLTSWQNYTIWAGTNFNTAATFNSFVTAWQTYTNWASTNFAALSSLGSAAYHASTDFAPSNVTNTPPVVITNIATAVFTTFTTLWQPSANGSVCPSGGTWTDSSWVGNTNQIYPQ